MSTLIKGELYLLKAKLINGPVIIQTQASSSQVLYNPNPSMSKVKNKVLRQILPPNT